MIKPPEIRARIDDAFWSPRLAINATRAIEHQWQQLESTGCFDNLRIAAGERAGFREGWFFADSDAFKWLDAACRIYVDHPSEALRARIDAFTALLARAQQPDGYLYTYNQIHFPGQRWVNLQIEHELYCLGHLIEAGIAHQEAFPPPPASRSDKSPAPVAGLAIARRAADLAVRELMECGPEFTDGHEEIELALVRLYRATGHQPYLRLAQQLLERRGRIRGFWRLILAQNQSVRRRSAQVQQQRQAYLEAHPEHAIRLPPGNASPRTRQGRARYYLCALTGKMLQQHRPVRDLREPVGHAVRFAYLETAAAMLARETGDLALRRATEAAWERMVRRRMSVTGGVGNLPETEGFGRDDELDPETAYNETCAALGCLFWNWEMALLTHEARYIDLFEWQLYNAASVGMGADGAGYLYNNPLASRGGIERRPWFQVPCCPSNLSRTWASLGKYLLFAQGDEIWVHQYVGCTAQVAVGSQQWSAALAASSLTGATLACGGTSVASLQESDLSASRLVSPPCRVRLRVDSRLPWEGFARITVDLGVPAEFTLHVRIPSWTRGYRVRVNGEEWEPLPLPPDRQTPVATAGGYAPHGAFYVPIRRRWSAGDGVELALPMPVMVRRPSRRVKSGRGRATITRGPLVYCLESIDNPDVDLFEAVVDRSSLALEATSGIDGVGFVVRAQTTGGRPLTFIPYFSWANRGPSQMNVMVRV